MVRPAHFWTEKANEEFKELWLGGVHVYDMGLHFGIHEATIRAHRHALGLPNRKISIWTEENSNYLKENWGSSAASAIGLKLNVTRNAVIGRAQRMGLDSKKRGPVTGSQRPRPQRAPILIRPPAPPPRKPFSWPELPSLDIPFLELKDGQCKFPVIGNSVYCGHPIVLRAYCGAHAKICYQL